MRSLVTVVAATVFFTLAACGGSNKPQVAAPTPTPCGPPVQETITYSANDAPFSEEQELCIGQHVTVTLSGWHDDEMVTISLLTQEQVDDLTQSFLKGHKVKLGEVRTSDGVGTFDFVLSSSYETAAGDRERIEHGQRLHVYAAQVSDTGAQAMGAGPLVVR